MEKMLRKKAQRLGLLTTVSAALMVMSAQSATAQQQQGPADQQCKDANGNPVSCAGEEELNLEEIIVTGSRIKRVGFEDLSQPAVVIGSETIEKRGYTNIADALNDTPGFGGGIDGITTGSGQNIGQEFLDLFDLGTQRTLTVVNGRRFVPGNVLSAAPNGRVEGSQVDINNFAPILVDRIEVLSIGGAPIYGADAIAGTINIVLKDDYEGMDLSVQFGDGFHVTNQDDWSVNGVFGANFADGRGNVTASIQFEDQRGAVANDFPRLRNQASSFGNGADPRLLGDEGRFNILEGPIGFLPAPTPGVPLPILGINVFTDSQGNVLTFPGTGGLGVFDPGTRVGTSVVFAEGGNGFDLDDFREFIVPVQRFVFSSTAHYDVAEGVRVFMETNFLNSNATDLISQSSSAFNTAFLNTQGIGSFGISIDNPFISPEDRQKLIDAGAGQTIYLNGIDLGLLPDAGANFADTTTFRVVGGLQGDFRKFDRHFNWEVSMNFGRTRQNRGESFIRGDAFFNAVDSIRLDDTTLAQLKDPANLDLLRETTNSQSINVIRDGKVKTIAPTDALAGDIVCSVLLDPPGPVDKDPANPNGSTGIVVNTPTPNAAVAGCTPVNLFNGFGNPPEAINFISSFGLSQGRVNQADLLAFISGDFIQLPAGWSQISVGVERRREFGSFLSDGTLEDGLTREPAIPSIPRTEIVSNEIFGELQIPLLSADVDLGINDALGFEFLSSLNLSGAYRLIDPSNSSPESIFSAGGTMSLLEDTLTLRGNYTRSVRQPSIVELFSPPAQTFDQTGDPCDNRNINNAPNTPRAQNCLTAAKNLGFTDAFLKDLGGGKVALVLAPGDDEFQTPSVNAAIPLTTAGNPNLTFEVGNSWTMGFIWRPKFVPNLIVGADFISISVKNTIVEPDFSFFTQDCFDNSNFAAGQFAESCNNFFRSGPTAPVDNTVISGFDIVTGTSGFQNSDQLVLKALQAQVRYEFDVRDALSLFGLGSGQSDLGSVSLRNTFYAPFVFRNSARGLPPQENGKIANQVGSTAMPALTMQTDFIYTYDKFDFFWRVTYTSSSQPCFKRVPGDCNDIPDFALNLPKDINTDASIGYQITDSLSFRGGVNNVMGNRLSRIEEAFGGFGSARGRTYFLRLNYSL